MVGTGSCYRATRVRSTSGRWLVAGRLLGGPGPTVQPMAWVGSRATPRAAGLQRMLWPGRPRMGAFGRPRLQERKGTRNRYPAMSPADASRCPDWEGSVAISVTVAPTTMTPSSQCDRHSETVNVSPGIDRHLRWDRVAPAWGDPAVRARDAARHAENRNSNHGLRVLLGKPDTTGAGERPTVEA